jgi:hydroxymethylpyrimidine pyrophosphatase-like HAD family hydrolase
MKITITIFLWFIFTPVSMANNSKANTIIFDFDYTIHNLNTVYTKVMIQKTNNDEKIIKNVEDTVRTEKQKETNDLLINQMIFRNASIKISKKDIDFVVGEIDAVIALDIIDIIKELERKGNKVLIIGGGAFGCAVIPQVMKKYGFKKENIYSGYFTGFDQKSIKKTVYDDYRYVNCAHQNELTPISTKKSEIVKFLKKQGKINGKVIHIGDGENDLEVYQSGASDYFIGFGIHKIREKVKKEAPIFVENINEFRNVIKEILRKIDYVHKN